MSLARGSLRARILLVPAVAALALTVAVTPAEGKRGCKHKREHKGCKLPRGASYRKALPHDPSSRSAYVDIAVKRHKFVLGLRDTPIPCSEGLIETAYLSNGLTSKSRARVGKRYTLTETEHTTSEEGGGRPETLTTRAKIKFKSAKGASVKLHYTDKVSEFIQCDGSRTFKLKRRK